MDKTMIETIMQNIGIKGNADAVITLIEDHPTYKKMNEEAGPDETIQTIAEDFANMFEPINTMPSYGSDEPGDEKPRKRSKYNPGKQKHNGASMRFDGPSKERGAQRAKDRHKRKGTI